MQPAHVFAAPPLLQASRAAAELRDCLQRSASRLTFLPVRLMSSLFVPQPKALRWKCTQPRRAVRFASTFPLDSMLMLFVSTVYEIWCSNGTAPITDQARRTSSTKTSPTRIAKLHPGRRIGTAANALGHCRLLLSVSSRVHAPQIKMHTERANNWGFRCKHGKERVRQQT